MKSSDAFKPTPTFPRPLPRLCLGLGLFLLIFLVFPLTHPSASAGAEQQLTINADQQIDLADMHYRHGDYQSAITEYKRFIYFFPDHPKVATAQFQIGMSQFQAQEYHNAIASFQTFINTYASHRLSARAYFKLSESHLALKDHGNALLTLHNLTQITRDTSIQDQAHYRTGWIHIERASWAKALKAFDKIRPANRVIYNLPTLQTEIETIQNMPQKSPQTAGMLAILPGAGHVYTKRYQDALISFTVNSALIVGAYASFNSGNEILGGVLTLIGLGFYSGNIYSAISSAHKYNRRQTEQSIQRLQKKKILFSAYSTGDGIGVAFNYRF